MAEEQAQIKIPKREVKSDMTTLLLRAFLLLGCIALSCGMLNYCRMQEPVNQRGN